MNELEVLCEPNAASRVENWRFYLKLADPPAGQPKWGYHVGYIDLPKGAAIALRKILTGRPAMTLRVKITKRHFDDAEPREKSKKSRKAKDAS